MSTPGSTLNKWLLVLAALVLLVGVWRLYLSMDHRSADQHKLIEKSKQ